MMTHKVSQYLIPIYVFLTKQQLVKLAGYNDYKNKMDLIIYRPTRLLLHELIVEFSLRAPYSSGDEQIFRDEIAGIMRNFFEDDALLDTIKSLEASIELENIQSIEELLSKKNEYTAKVHFRIVCMASYLVNIYLHGQNLTEIRVPDPKYRTTAMVVGGQASGKGSSIAILKQKMENAGIHWNDVVRINTDSYKPLVLKPGTVNKYLYSQLSQPEASTIHSKLLNRLTNQAMDNKAPHVIIDQVFLGNDKLQYAMINGGIAIIMVVSTEVISAVKRSFNRGDSEIPP